MEQQLMSTLAVCIVVGMAILPVFGAEDGFRTKGVLHSNTEARRDVGGSIMDAHDGSYRLFNGVWHYHAMGYGLCIETGRDAAGGCGSGMNNSINLWTSPDLVQWSFVSDVLPVASRPNCVYYRPNVVYNARNMRYVLWANAKQCPDVCLGVSSGCYLAFTADTPAGPFALEGPVRTKYTTDGGVGDYSLFIDDDQAAYCIHKRTGQAPPPNGHRMLIERLDADYLHSTNITLGIFGDPFVEAPVMFKRRGVYYALFGKCCAFCSTGSGVGVYTATQPLGPYTYHLNVGCPTEPAEGCGCGGAPYTRDPNKSCAVLPTVTKAQQNFVIQVPQPNGTMRYLWTGDQWQSACRIPNLKCVKGWDLQFWSDLDFDDSISPAVPKRLHWVDSVPLSVVGAAARQYRQSV